MESTVIAKLLYTADQRRYKLKINFYSSSYSVRRFFDESLEIIVKL